MKMKIGLLLMCVLGAVSCMSSDAVKGNGNIITKTIPVENFTELDLGDQIESKGNPFSSKNRSIVLNYTQTTGNPSLEITMDENLFDLLDINQKDGRLRIQAKSGKINPSQLLINGSSTGLQRVDVNGCMDFIAESPVNLTEVLFNISGVGDVKLSALTCDKFTGNLSGVGKMYLAGQIKEGEFNVSGVGHVYAFDCPVEQLNCGVSGVGGMEVNATKLLQAQTSGIGSIKYKGNPETVSESTSGIGRIKRVD